MAKVVVGPEVLAMLAVMEVTTGEGPAWGPSGEVTVMEGFLAGWEASKAVGAVEAKAVAGEERVAIVVAIMVAAMAEGVVAMETEEPSVGVA